MSDVNELPAEAVLKDSEDSVVENNTWAPITPNTEILIFAGCGLIGTLLEVAGYWPTITLRGLLPESEDSDEEEVLSDLKDIVFKISEAIDLARFYSVHIYLATYILLPYPLLTERQKVLLAPWLICGVLRSVLLNLLLTLVAIVLCASEGKLHYPCLQYSAYYGAEFCVSFFVWTSVHNFYHYLETKKSEHTLTNLLKAYFHRAGNKNLGSSSRESADRGSIFSVDSIGQDDDDGAEATLVERAAMAWIAREILEDDGEYVTDGQFSRYLAVKATAELRRILKEISERKMEQKILRGEEVVDEGTCIECSLGFCKATSRLRLAPDQQHSAAAPRRGDSVENTSGDVDHAQMDAAVRYVLNPGSNVALTRRSTVGVKRSSVEVQTDPLSPQMNKFFDDLQRKYTKQRP